MSEDKKDPEMDPLLEEWEAHRRVALRSFRVRMANGDVETVFAHFWDNPRHWNFYTIQASGRRIIGDSFGSEFVVQVKEITDLDVDKSYNKMMETARKIEKLYEQKAVERTVEAALPPKPRKDVH